MKPEISVVIPSFERAEQTARAIWSVLRQQSVQAEIVVVDDASSTPLSLSEELTESGRVRLLRLPENRGAAAARNAGVEASKSDVIAFLDSDDFFLPDTLARRLDFFRVQDASVPFLCAAGVWRWSPSKGAVLAMPAEADDIETFAAGCWYFPGSTAIFSKKVWGLVGPLDASLRRLEDLEWGIRLGLAGGRLSVAPLAASAVTRSRPAAWPTVARSCETLLTAFGPHSTKALPETAWLRLQAYLALERANAAFGDGRYGSMAASLLKSFYYAPRRSLHLQPWWQQRSAQSAERDWIAGLAIDVP